MALTGSQLAARAIARVKSISPEDAFREFRSGNATLIDVREADELVNDGRIQGAVHVPRGLLEFAADPGNPGFHEALKPANNLVLFCDVGTRSALATESLTQLGFGHVANMAGGLAAWISQGLPIQRKAKVEKGISK